MNTFCLDLGTNTGYAYNVGSEFFCGTWTLATAREIKEYGRLRLNRRGDPRIKRLANLIAPFCGKIDAIVFEDVQWASTTYQCQLWASLRAAVWISCDNEIVRECVPVQTLKKFAVAGNADKAAMSAALKKKHPQLWTPTLGDDTIDAIWLWLWSQQHLRIK